MNKDFLSRMQKMLIDYDDFIKSYEEEPTRGIRCLCDVNLDIKKIPYGINEYYLLSKEKLGNHPLHHLGAIYLQEPSAMGPVNLLDFKEDAIVLDLCASPGGKSGQIAERIKKGLLVSNEIDKKRSQILYSNIERMGYDNVIITNNEASVLAKNFKNTFDVILVDAPCSCEGMFRKDKEAVNMWSLENVNNCSKRDLEILEYANEMLKKDGFLIYSTCTFSKEENEDVLINFMKKHNYVTVQGNKNVVNMASLGYIDNAYRFYPHRGIGEGQFMCLLQKKEECENSVVRPKYAFLDSKEKQLVNEFIKENTSGLCLNLIKRNNQIYHLIGNLNLNDLNVVSYGVHLGEITNRFIPNHHFFKVFGKSFNNVIHMNINDDNVYKYLKGEEISFDTKKGYGVIMINDLILGGFKASNGVLKNLYPKGLRNF